MARSPARLRWGLRPALTVLSALIMGCLLLGLTLALCLPWLVERTVARELSRRGLGNITVGVQAISWRQATLGPVAVCGEDGLVRAAAVVLHYAPSRLRHGQVDAVEVVGLRLRWVRRGSAWVPGAQQTLRRALDEARRLTPAGGSPGVYPTLELRSSQLELETNGEVVTFPLEGTARVTSVDPSHLQVVVWVCGNRVTVAAVVELGTGTGTVTLECQQLDLGAWLQMAAWAGVPVPDALADVSGRASCRARADLDGYVLRSLAADAVASGLGVSLGPLPVRLREATLALRSGPDLRRPDITFTAYSEGIGCGVQVIEPFRCSGSYRDDTLACTAAEVRFRLGSQLAGTAQWRLSAQGLPALDTALFDVGIDVTRAEAFSLGSCVGHMRAVGTLADLWVNGTLEAAAVDRAQRLAAITLDGRVQHAAGTEITGAATLIVQPPALASRLGAGVQLSTGAIPLDLTVALALPSVGSWRGSCTLGLPPQPATVTAPGLQLSAALGLACRVDADASGVTLAGRLEAMALTAEAHGITVAADACTLALDAVRCPWPRGPARARPGAGGLRAPDGLEVEAQMALRKGSLRLAGGLQCEGIDAALPVAWRSPGGLQERPDVAPGDGFLRTGPIRFRTFAAAGLQGRCTAAGQALRFEGELACTAPGVTVSVTQTLRWQQGLALALHYEMPPFHVKGDEGWYPGAPGAGGARLGGMLAASGDVLVDRQGWRSPCRLRLTDGELTWPQQKLTVRGLDADVTVLDLLQARTAPFQTIRFTSALIQDVPVEGGQIVFATDGLESLSLLRCELDWCGGRVHTQAVHLDARNPALDLVLFAESVDIVRALNLVKGLNAKGTGVLNGKLPISYRNGRLSYSKGYLYSLPGQPGRLQLQSTGWLTSSVGKDHPAYAELQQAEKALEDFRLDEFGLVFTGEQAGTPGAKIRLTGEGVNGKVPVTLNLNVNGPIEEVLNLGLRLGGM